MRHQLCRPPPRRGFFVNVGSLVFARGFLAASQVLVLPIVARYLTVEEFALMAMAMTVVIFGSVLSDAGLGRSLIRTKSYDAEEWSSVFWLLVGVGFLLALAILAVAPFWARLFDQPPLWEILSVLSVVPLCQAVSAAPNAEVERREDYIGIARLHVVAAGGGLIAAVILAVAGAGVWALVAQQLVLALVRLAGMAVLSRFRPTLAFSRARLGGHLRFSRDAISISLISVAQGEAAVVAIAKSLGEEALGIFAMSRRFTRLPQFGLAGPMSAVVYVRMAKAQDEPERLVGIYLASTRLLASALLPPLAMLAISGSAVFTVLLSEDWARVAPIFALSIPGMALEAVAMTCLACLFRAVGRTDLQLRLKIEGAVLRLLLVVVASLIGLEAVAASLTVWGLIFVLRGWAVAGTIVPLGLGYCLRTVALPAAVATIAVLAHVLLMQALKPPPVHEIAIAAGLTGASLGIVALLDRKRLWEAISLFR